jgi:hypothetical protein
MSLFRVLRAIMSLGLAAQILALSAAYASAAPLSFVELTLLEGQKMTIDPSKITAFASLPWGPPPAVRGQQQAPPAPVVTFPLPPIPKSLLASSPPETTKTQLLGVLATLMPVNEKVEEVKKIVDIEHFVKLTLVSGTEIWMRAASIGWMMEKYPGLDDPRSKCVVSLSLGRGSPTPVREDLQTVKKLVEDMRSKPPTAP